MTTAQLLIRYLLTTDAQRIPQSRVFNNTVLELTQCVKEGVFSRELVES
jgi:hypothetical protein